MESRPPAGLITSVYQSPRTQLQISCCASQGPCCSFSRKPNVALEDRPSTGAPDALCLSSVLLLTHPSFTSPLHTLIHAHPFSHERTPSYTFLHFYPPSQRCKKSGSFRHTTPTPASFSHFSNRPKPDDFSKDLDVRCTLSYLRR